MILWLWTMNLILGLYNAVAVLFSEYSKPLAFIPPIYLEGIEIEYKNSAKYLEVTLDRQLNYKEYIEQKSQRQNSF